MVTIVLLLLLLSRFSCIRLSATPWTAAYQAPLSMGFSRQEYWSGVPLPSPAAIQSHLKVTLLILVLLLFLTHLQSLPPVKSCWCSVSSVTQSCLTLCNLMDCSMPGLPVLYQLPELAQTHVHWVSNAIQPSHPLSSPSSPPFNISQHQGLF